MKKSDLKKDFAWILQSVPAELTTPAAQDTASRLVRLLAEKGVPFEPEDDTPAEEEAHEA